MDYAQVMRNLEFAKIVLPLPRWQMYVKLARLERQLQRLARMYGRKSYQFKRVNHIYQSYALEFNLGF